MFRFKNYLNALWFLLIIDVCVGYNLDGRNVIVVGSEQIGDYFGYSLILRNDGRYFFITYKFVRRLKIAFSIFVGAPKGNSSYKPNVDSPGVLYNCSIFNRQCVEHTINNLATGKRSSRFLL